MVNNAEYNGAMTRVIKDGDITEIPRKADLGFEYDAFIYSTAVQYKVIADAATPLEESDIVAIIAFIDNPVIPEEPVAEPEAPVEKTAEEIQEETNTRAREFLKSTDWMIIRELETGRACADDIKALRQQKRESIVE